MTMTPMVKRLLIANLAVTVALLVLRRVDVVLANQILEWVALTPGDLLRGRVWQLATYMFVHVDPFHLLLNCLFLWLIGGNFEPRWGSRSFLRFIVLSGVGAGVVVTLAGLLLPSMNVATVGISGSLHALLMAFALLAPEQPIYFYGLLPVKGKHLVWIVVGVDLLFALAGSATSLPAHLGGLLMGYLLITGRWRPSKWRRGPQPGKKPNRAGLRLVRPGSDDDGDRPKYLN